MSKLATISAMFTVLFLACSITLSTSTPESTEHGSQKTQHYKDGTHNPVFDREALLGSHRLNDLAELPNEVRINRLRNLAKSHDANNNDIIEADELKEWILQSFRMLDREEAMEKLEEEDENEDGKVTFEEILHKEYGYNGIDFDLENPPKDDEEDADVYPLIQEDRKRFAAADLDMDGFLDETEYVAYYQPYEFPHMHGIEIERAVKDLDGDADGFISMEEFIGDNKDEESRLTEMTNFEELDVDKDGKLTPEELRKWALPDNSEIAQEEADHLISMCDSDKDGHLSVDEIVSKEDEFLSSAATDYGRTLHFVRDEL